MVSPCRLGVTESWTLMEEFSGIISFLELVSRLDWSC